MKFNNLVPELSVSDLKKSIEFYAGVLGFKIEYSREESKFVFLSFQGSQIMLEEINGHWDTGKLEHPFGRGINFQIEVNDVNALAKSLSEIKYPIRMMPKDSWYRKGDVLFGSREFLVQDPDGYLLRFSQSIGKKRDVSARRNPNPCEQHL